MLYVTWMLGLPPNVGISRPRAQRSASPATGHASRGIPAPKKPRSNARPAQHQGVSDTEATFQS